MPRSATPAAKAEPIASKPKRTIAPASPFKFVNAPDVQACFSRADRRESVYLAALQELVRNQASGKREQELLLEFERPGARGAIAQQARKHGIKVLFGYSPDGAKLYVRLLGVNTAESVVLQLLEKGAAELSDIAKHLAAEGFADVKAKEVMSTLADNHRAQLLSVPGNPNIRKWHRLHNPLDIAPRPLNAQAS